MHHIDHSSSPCARRKPRIGSVVCSHFREQETFFALIFASFSGVSARGKLKSRITSSASTYRPSPMLIFTGMLSPKSRTGFGSTGSGRSDVRPHHHRLHASRGDQRFEFIDNVPHLS